tara:strand:+ start:206 stop:829 length:624 start_codon:yes stop_codon:yes gene_type:complete
MDFESSENKGIIYFIKSKLKIIISILIFLFFIILFMGWMDYQNKKNKLKLSENFIEAKVLLSENKKIESYEIFKQLVNKKEKIYSPLSLFFIIDRNLENDENVLLKYFDTILSIKDLEPEDLNLMKLKKAIFISQNADEQSILSLLNPIINSNSVWKAQSLKFLGDYYFSTKEFKKAGEYYSILIDEKSSDIDISELKRKMKLIKND